MRKHFDHLLVLALASVAMPLAAQTAVTATPGAIPKVGDTAADFTLTGLDGKTVRLSDETARGPVVLLMMRGWPGYQCPLCTKQVAQFIGKAKDIDAAHAQVVMVYPGPAEGLKAHADEFAAQAALLRDIFGNPFRPASCDPSWLTPAVVALATAIYRDRAFDRMPSLADALQDAGCDVANILTHCRSDEPHVRGCWVTDLLLGRH